jgi:hypothetical protein
VKISDFIFRFSTGRLTRNDAICRVRLFVSSNSAVYAVPTDLGEKNTGSPVTNSVENIRQALVDKGLITEEAKIIEHYDKDCLERGSFDFVSFDENNNPRWKSTGLTNICSILESVPEEFLTYSLKIPRLYDEIEKIRHSIDPYIDEPWAESYDIINRREDIKANMLPEGELLKAIERGASETEIHNLVKSDLSIIGDFYSHPSEEYICFSEFPLSDGFVDFVMFSGRSRMDVTLIEIKGANYNLINGNSYEDFSAKTNQAVQQIRRRIGYIRRNYEKFCNFVHYVRQTVENGETKFNAFVGPKGKLCVDPNKDINVHTVVIGGRSKDDLNESRLRHEYEMGNSPPIRIESWDSWIKKSRRK